ncbi:MAG: tetratricopeptide repeat protein [Myxococcota bacterium]|nr:tetratricopeptide repeat protein [Myxococcota bacterium]
MSRVVTLLLVLLAPASASAWDPFLVPNDHVEDGNARMADEDPSGALHHYEQAARQLPNEPGVHLNRGLALLDAGELDRALEAFEVAAEPGGPREIRADAYYDMGLVYYQQGDAAAAEEDHQEAQRLFREAAERFRQSLRQRPGNADAGWNLELALRRLHEEEEAQEQQEQEEQEQQEQNQDQQQQNQDQQGQDQQQQDQDQQQQDQQGEDEQPQDQQGQDEQPQDSEGDEGEPQEDEGGSEESDDEQPSDDSSDQGEGQPQEGDGQQPPEPQPSTEGTREAMPEEHRRVLDALQDGEDNLERHRARSRAAQERRRVEQDW